ncbi:MAG: ABC transporter substrate-binding protein, partial [Cyclobacteriaceae bacterium]|nr:ABC transporter substrate-binding protein [Cyclobacteriaceae bacterium]
FCVHPPEWFKGLPKVGGTKNFRFDVIDQLSPDLIIGNKEENYLAGISVLQAKYPVWMTDVSSYQEALQTIVAVGALTDKEQQAASLRNEIEARLQKLTLKTPRRVLYLIWRQPWMAAGKGTFIDSMLSKIGLVNVVEETRYPTFSEAQLQQLQPELIYLSSEPYPFKQEHIRELQTVVPKAEVTLVDGELFSWYGSRMLLAPDYFASLTN